MLNSISKRLHRVFLDTPLNQKYISRHFLRKNLRTTLSYISGRLLDVGCGEKQYYDLVKSKTDSYIGLEHPACYFNDIQVEVFGDAHHLPFKTESFNTILCTQVLMYIKEPSQVFKELSRVLKKGAYLIVSADKSYPNHRSGSEYFRFTHEGLRFLAESNGLHVNCVKPICGLPATIGLYLSRYIYGTFMVSSRNQRPRIWLTPLILPFCALVQLFFLLIDSITNHDSSETDTITYILIAQKRSDPNPPSCL